MSHTRNPTERKTVYEGYIHKCPNCGEILKSFLTVGPTCGHEIRDFEASTSVRELSLKLESISAQKMPTLGGTQSVKKKGFGKKFKKGDEAEEAFRRFESQKAKEKASLIINFSVPNTKEDIMEFMILASSNIDAQKDIDDEVTKAWRSKLEQVYQKAEITMGGHPDFVQVKSIYDRKKEELKNNKVKALLLGAGLFFLWGMLSNPAATIGIIIGILILIIIGFILFKKR